MDSPHLQDSALGALGALGGLAATRQKAPSASGVRKSHVFFFPERNGVLMVFYDYFNGILMVCQWYVNGMYSVVMGKKCVFLMVRFMGKINESH